MAHLPKGQGIIPLPPFSAFLASNIPAVYDNTMSYYEELCALLKYLRDQVTPALNSNAEAITVLSNYVEHYFDDLDVQQEINNKLDEMAEDGTLQEIIAEYLNAQALWCFDTVADMKTSTNLIEGSSARTLGYHAIDDGGEALYRVRTVTNDDVVDEGSIIALSDDRLVAELVADEANPLQFGAYGDATHNDTTAIQACANYALAHNLAFHMPPKNYLTDTITIQNLRTVNIEGHIKLTSSNESLNVYEDVNGVRPNIYINQVTVGDIVMKGLNSATVQILDANRLLLIADNTEGHEFIGYTTFTLGFIRYLIIEDDGSGQKWVNENLFTGGRYLEVTIGGNNSSFPHENNLFLEPMCEHTTWNFNYCTGNRVVKARLEGTVTINFAANAVANTVEQDFGGAFQSYYNPSHMLSDNITVNDQSGGQNYVITNKNLLIDKKIVTLNKFFNPNSVTVQGEYLKPGQNTNLWTSQIVELPDKVFALWLEIDNPHVDFRIRCYNSSKQLLSSVPSTPLLKNSPTIALVNAHDYGNGSYNRFSYWAIITPNNPDIKYIQVLISTANTEAGNNARFRNIDLTLTSYDELNPYVIEGLSKSA